MVGERRFPDVLLDKLQKQLTHYEERRDNSSLRDLIVMIGRIETTVRELGKAAGVAAGLSPTSARQRIRGYFEALPNQVIEGIELAMVSGIPQYARRIRELRDDGFVIQTGPETADPESDDELRPDQYIYVTVDRTAAPTRRS